MKKLLLFVIFTLVSITSFSQNMWFKSTEFAFATVRRGNYNWGDWKRSNIDIQMDVDNDMIIIYSAIVQRYRIYDTYNHGNVYYDSSGGKQIKFYVIDQDGDYGYVRLRMETNGTSQLYIDFNDSAWVYNVTRIQ